MQAQVENLEDSDEGSAEEGQWQAQFRPPGHSEEYPAQGTRMTFLAPTGQKNLLWKENLL